MADFLRDAVDWLHGVRQERMVGTITYSRAGQSVDLDATRGRTRIEQQAGDNETVEASVEDFLIRASELVLFGERTKPKRGDTIEETVGDVTRTYTVMPVADEGEWRWSDPYTDTIRVHTKFTGET